MSEEEVERRSLEDLKAVLQEAHKRGIKLVIIGGYAVAAYTRGYRYTKDIDLVSDTPTLGILKELLKSHDYATRDTEFGIAGFLIFLGSRLSYGSAPGLSFLRLVSLPRCIPLLV
jgi:hypothetical protein